MPIRTWLRFLRGDRVAILEIAAHWRSLFIGFLFVLSAAFAREYDQEDLWHCPGYLLLPFGVSLVAAFVLFGLSFVSVKRVPIKPSFKIAFPMFLSLFWMTAPLAWLYAVPYEHFLSPLGATRANLITLGIVSLWRVGLMIRVLMVLMNYSALAATSLVMFIADVEALLGLLLLPWPLIDVMGGLMLSENEALRRSTANAAAGFGCWTLPVWFVGLCYSLSRANLVWNGPISWRAASTKRGWLLPLALASIGIWAIILPFSQPLQVRRRQVEELVRGNRFAEALALMSTHDRSAFPPMWDPPPHTAWDHPTADKIAVELSRNSTAKWVTKIWLQKLKQIKPFWINRYENAQFEEMIHALQTLPDGDEVLATWFAMRDGDIIQKQIEEMRKTKSPLE